MLIAVLAKSLRKKLKVWNKKGFEILIWVMVLQIR